MNLKLLICVVVLATLTFCASKQRLRRGRRRAAGSSKIPYASLSAGVIPSRVRSHLRGNRRTSVSRSSQSGSEPRVRPTANSDASSGGYASGRPTHGSQYGYPTNGGYAGNSQYGSQQQYAQQSGGRQMVPAGRSTFPYATSGIYSGPSQSRYSSQQVPIPSTYRGGQARYPMQQASRYPAPAQQPYYPQQQLSGAGYAGGYPSQGNPYGNPYGTRSYGNANPQMQQAYGSYGQQQQQQPYGGSGYDNSYSPGAIGSPYRDPSSLFTSYVHPQADNGNRLMNPYYGASQYGSDGTSNYYGSRSNYQSSNVPSGGALGTSGYGQNQQSNPYYGYGRSSDQSAVPGSGARDYGQGQASQYPYGASGGNQYGSDASNSFGMGSQPAYDGAAYGQGNQYGGSYGSSMQSPMSGAQPSNYPDYSGSRRTGSSRLTSSQQHFGSPSSRYSGQQIASNSRVQTPSRNMHDSASADFSRGSSSLSRYYQAGQDDSRNTENHRSSAQYFNPETARTISPPSASRVSVGADHASNPGRGYQIAQRNPSAGVSPVYQQRNGGRVVTLSRSGSQDERSGSYQIPTRDRNVPPPVYQQRNDTDGVVTVRRPSHRYEQSGTYLVGSRDSRISVTGVASNEGSTVQATPPSPATASSLSQCQVQNDGLPDLTLYPTDLKKDKSIFLDTRRRDEILCAINENCLSKLHPRISRRLLLRFPTIVHNIGTADFFPDLPPQNWIYHTCHKHYHSMQEFAHFFLYNENGTVVGEGHKVSFCLQDSGCKNPCTPRYNCSGATRHERPSQAISPGCYDDYKASLDCQWIDITGIPTNGKDYTLKIIVNPVIDGDRAVAELSYMNNAVACKITIQSDAELVVGRCYRV